MYTTDAGLVRQDMKMASVDECDIHRASVPVYSDVEHQTWATLLANQQRVLPGRACREFMTGLETIDFPRDHIPRLADISDRVEAATGWRLVRVDGIVPDDAFFALLASRHFPSTDFIRKPEELGYTPAPDMFHDLLGHVPLLTDARFCAFFERFGQVGVRAFELDHPAKTWLPRLYWYAVEFGLIRERGEHRIYGSGILSSPDEVLFSLSDATEKRRFDVGVIAAEPYDIWHMQQKLFVIDSFDQLEDEFAHWADKLF
ncbi:MAG: phenylalanine 4-monooxygenase [Paludibacterium sp.]|uniref:phenylalanine 4-monooxygenase n=1 Tax=Paludibacterium sp. TaxID=1917523 RepID=UPI0025D28571|nr:phenylalanine 4-monooxygenase [Paludibacterium sp.]MBV8047982.1 phenylalanine 4-monooxygenase [Paludibacterium sp.]MBV8649150.1 phenylalanine 4-monooxygenase [Paludibacterium sp.]